MHDTIKIIITGAIKIGTGFWDTLYDKDHIYAWARNYSGYKLSTRPLLGDLRHGSLTDEWDRSGGALAASISTARWEIQ